VCNEISAAATILTDLLDQYAKLTALLKEFVELDTDRLAELLGVLDWGARQGYKILSGQYEQDGPNDHDQDLQTMEPLSFEATVASRLIADRRRRAPHRDLRAMPGPRGLIITIRSRRLSVRRPIPATSASIVAAPNIRSASTRKL
jgi:hypothetical protein